MKVLTMGTGTIDTCMSGKWSRNCTFKTKTKDLEGIPLLGGYFGYKPPWECF